MGPVAELLLLSRRNRIPPELAHLRVGIRRDRWDATQAALLEILYTEPTLVLRALLEPARDPATPPALRIEAYRLLSATFADLLGDWRLAKAVHREWIDLSLNRSDKVRLASLHSSVKL